MRVFLALISMLPLAACGSSSNVTRADASPPTVTYNVDDTRHMEEADARADAFCSRYNRPARLVSLDQKNDHYVANYVCG